MDSEEFRARSRCPGGAQVSRDEARTALWLWGEHDVATTGLLRAALVEAIALDDADVVVDLTDVGFMDASTLGVLVRGRELLRIRGRVLNVRSPQRCPRKVLEVCGLGELIEAPAGAAPDGRDAPTALETVDMRQRTTTEGRARIIALEKDNRELRMQ